MSVLDVGDSLVCQGLAKYIAGDLLTYWHCLHSTWSTSIKLLSVRPSVCPIIRLLHAAVVCFLLWMWQPGDWLIAAWCSAPNASSITLSADIGNWTQTCNNNIIICFHICIELNKEDAMDRCKWRKVIKEVRWPRWVWAGECFFW